MSMGLDARIWLLAVPLLTVWWEIRQRRTTVVILLVVIAACGYAHAADGFHPAEGDAKRGAKRDVVHARDLVLNPFHYEGKIIVLDVLSVPFLSDGNVFSWQQGVEAVGRTGLRFRRIWAEGEALYDVVAVDVGPGSGDLEVVGQLVVVLPPYLPPPDQRHVEASSSGPLPLDKLWAVKPRGVVHATNGFGAPVQIPVVKICYTTACNDVAPDQAAAPTPKTRDTLPVVRLYDLVLDPYLHRGQKVLLDFTTASAVIGASHQPWRDGPEGLRFSKMLDERTALYDVVGMDVQNWRAGFRPVGQLVVLLPPDAKRLACPSAADSGPICLTGTQWVVEPSGPYQGLNAFGAPAEAPAVRFVAKAAEYQAWQDDETLTDIQKAIFTAHRTMNRPAPGHSTSCYSPATGAPCIAIPPAPREEDYDTRMAWREALDAWRTTREELMQNSDATWRSRRGE